MISRSASRTFWKITCLAVCASMRPKSAPSTLMPISSPTDGFRVELVRFVDLDLFGFVEHFGLAIRRLS